MSKVVVLQKEYNDGMNPTFQVFFNGRKQWVDVYLHDVHPTTFATWKMGRWAMFDSKWENSKSGHFGDIHIVENRVREDTVAHELLHAWIEWLWANRTAVTSRNEEALVSLFDQMIGRFYREYNKYLNRR